MNDARDNVFHNRFVIGAISLSPKSTTDTTFIMHKSQQTMLAIVNKVVSLDLLHHKLGSKGMDITRTEQ